MPPELKKILEGLQGLHLGIASATNPNGQDLYCHVCGYHFHATVDDCANYYAHGWPKHCGKEMRWHPKAEARL